MDGDCLPKGRSYRRSPEHIRHKSASTRAQFHKIDRVRLPYLLPNHAGPETDKLAKHLGNFRSSCEVSGTAKRILFGIISVMRMIQAKVHVPSQCNRALQANFAAEDIQELNHIRVPQAVRRNPQMIIPKPMISMGTESHCPMVLPSVRRPIWESGWRKSSIIIRMAA